MDTGEENLPLLREISPIETSKLFFYGLGHVYNDLCAAIWFSYTLFYFQIVLEMEATTAGTLIMLGQVADSLATPACGWAIDRLSTPRVWHKAGTALVAVGFSMIFSLSPLLTSWWSLLYYSTFVIIFQIGWAIVQISHLSVIPVISNDLSQSSNLTTIRYTASVCCNIFVYLLTWVILKNGDMPNSIGPEDFYKFRELVLIVTCLGLCTSVIFYCGILTIKSTTIETSQITENDNNKHFLRSCTIYLVSIMYMSSRLYTILNLIYIPLYLEERYNNSDENQGIRSAVAVVPLISFTASLFASILLKFRPKRCNDHVTYLIGALFCLAGSTWIAYGIPWGLYYQIYAVVGFAGTPTCYRSVSWNILQRIGGSATMVSSLCLTAHFVKTNGFQGGSVYSTVTFTDKILSGAVVLLIQHMQCSPKDLCPNFYEKVLAYACGSAGILGLFSLVLLSFKQ